MVRSVSSGVCEVEEHSGAVPPTGQLLPGEVTVPVLGTDAAPANTPGGSTSVAGNGSAAWTVTFTVTVAPAAMVPSVQVTVVVPAQVLSDETKVRPAGRASVTTTPVAGTADVFVTV